MSSSITKNLLPSVISEPKRYDRTIKKQNETLKIPFGQKEKSLSEGNFFLLFSAAAFRLLIEKGKKGKIEA